MAIKRVVQKDLYQYTEDIVSLSKQDVRDARGLFDSYRDKKIILNKSFDDETWILTNEVTTLGLNFSLAEDLYSAKAAKEIGCSYRNFCSAVRVYAINSLHFSLHTVRRHINAIMQFARSAEVPKSDFESRIVADFLELLPGNTPLRDMVSTRAFCRTEQQGAEPRTLVNYVSYFRFSYYLDLFWHQATPEEKLVYFPIFLWWSLTSILPLRVTEYLLTPRDCLVYKNNSWMIRVRRTKLKTRNGQAQHSIASDYEIMEYPILGDLAEEIRAYISATESDYASDIDVLLSRQDGCNFSNSHRWQSRHYTRNHLNRLLIRFYEEILREKYRVYLVASEIQLGENEINWIRLGDTRHVAIINLLVSGSSLVACKELSRHFDIYSAQHYYYNVKSFLSALNFEYLIPVSARKILPQRPLLPEAHVLVPELTQTVEIPSGRCASQRYIGGDYSDCALAVDNYGQIGACSHCKFVVPNKVSMIDYTRQADVELQKNLCINKRGIEQLPYRQSNPAGSRGSTK